MILLISLLGSVAYAIDKCGSVAINVRELSPNHLGFKGPSFHLELSQGETFNDFSNRDTEKMKSRLFDLRDFYSGENVYNLTAGTKIKFKNR